MSKIKAEIKEKKLITESSIVGNDNQENLINIEKYLIIDNALVGAHGYKIGDIINKEDALKILKHDLLLEYFIKSGKFKLNIC